MHTALASAGCWRLDARNELNETKSGYLIDTTQRAHQEAKHAAPALYLMHNRDDVIDLLIWPLARKVKEHISKIVKLFLCV